MTIFNTKQVNLNNMNNPTHIFRMTHKNNIQTFLNDGFICANQQNQKQWAISYSDIVQRRSISGALNDKVAFYFSPITAMQYTISINNVVLTNLNGMTQGKVDINDVVFMVMRIEKALEYEYEFTNRAFNSTSNIAQIYNDWDTNKNKIEWKWFNETPAKGTINEISYNGSCKFFQNIERNGIWYERSQIRMAEFWIKNKVDLLDIQCFVVKTEQLKQEIEQIINSSQFSNIPVYCKQDVFF